MLADFRMIKARAPAVKSRVALPTGIPVVVSGRRMTGRTIAGDGVVGKWGRFPTRRIVAGCAIGTVAAVMRRIVATMTGPAQPRVCIPSMARPAGKTAVRAARLYPVRAALRFPVIGRVTLLARL